MLYFSFFFFFFFNDTATTEIYTLSLHDALPILPQDVTPPRTFHAIWTFKVRFWSGCVSILSSSKRLDSVEDRKSTRLNSSHLVISYAVFCLKKKKKKNKTTKQL